MSNTVALTVAEARARLYRRYPDQPPEVIDALISETQAAFSDARVVTFLGVLIERAVAERLLAPVG